MLPFDFNRVKLDKNFNTFAMTRSASNSFCGSRVPFEPNPGPQLPVFQGGRPTSQTIAPSQKRAAVFAEENFDDYINASWVDSCLKKQLLIAASAPKKNTATDFLHMIMENNVKLVMKVCEDKVVGREQCYRYTGQPVPAASDKDESSHEKSGVLSTATFTTQSKDNKCTYVVDVMK